MKKTIWGEENRRLLKPAKNNSRRIQRSYNIELLKDIILTQKNILKKEGCENTPQLFVVYKEVKKYWNGGKDPATGEMVEGLKQYYREENWCAGVSWNIRITESQVTLQAGLHTLQFYAVDPGLVLQKLVLFHGELPESYLGPPESPNTKQHFHGSRYTCSF